MNETPQTEFNVGLTLAELLERDGPQSPREGLQLVYDLAMQVQTLHACGLTHRSIRPESVTFDTSRRPVLCANLPQTAIVQPIDPEWFPPELSCEAEFLLPGAVEHGRAELKARGIELDPRRIDIYQLSVLLCRVLTGSGAADYLRSAVVKGSVPERVSRLIDHGIGFDSQNRCNDVGQLIDGIRTVLAEYGDAGATGGKNDTSTSVSPPGSTDETTVASESLARREQESVLPFQTLGHYTILERVGRGGMGDVYRAHDNSLNRTVALKVLPNALARQEEFIQRFRAEATAAAKLTHPNIVQIHSIDEDAGVHFFTMQFVHGQSLADLLRQRDRLSIDESLEIVVQLLAGLAAAHKQGLVHRDIKPANVLIDEEHRRALLADFGLVKSLGTASGQTATGVVLGTVDYISPEQGRGQSVDQRSDLYSIGVLVYRMLSGQLPFEADSPTAMIFQHVYETPKDLSEAASDVPRWIADVVAKLLSKKPADRYESADALLEELKLRMGPPARKRLMARGQLVTAPGADDQLATPVGDILSPGRWPTLRDCLLGFLQRKTPRLLERLASTEQQVDAAVAAYKARCRELEVLANDAEAVVGDLSRQAEIQREAEQLWRQRANLQEEANEQEAARQQQHQCHREVFQLVQQISQQQSELDEIRVLYAKANATLSKLCSQRDLLKARLQLASASTQPAKRSIGHWGRWLAALSLIGVSLAAAFTWRLGATRDATSTDLPSTRSTAEPQQTEVVVDADPAPPELAANEIQRFTDHSAAVLALAISGDGRTLLSGSEDRSAMVWDVATGKRKRTLRGHNLGVRSISFLPAEDQAVTAGADHVLRRWDLLSGKTLMIYSGHSNEVASIEVSGDGERFVSGSYDAGIILWEKARPTPRWILEYKYASDIPPLRVLEDINALEAHVTWVRTVAFSPDGLHFVSGGNEALLAIWDVAERKIVRRLIGHTQPISQVAYTEDGKRVISSSFDATVRIWDTETGDQTAVLSGHQGPVLCVAVSPDDRFLATGSPDLTVRVWSLDDVAEIQRLEGHSGQIEAVVWSPDGSSVFTASADQTIRQWKIGG